MNRLFRAVPIICAGTILAIAGCGQSPHKKSYAFHGKVEAINKANQSLMVNGENVEGWMEAMTMEYKVDDPGMLGKVKPGDRITATVYDGDYSLHQVRVDGTESK